MAGPPRKQRCVENDIFDEFRHASMEVKQLTAACTAIRTGFSEMKLCILRILRANACSRQSFPQAICDVETFRTDSNYVLTFTIGSIYMEGLFVLGEYLKAENPSYPCGKDKTSLKALRKLLTFLMKKKAFLSETYMTMNSGHSDVEKCKWAVILAQHLISELAAESSYTVDNHSFETKLPKKDGDFICPCNKGEMLVGNTSFGCVDAWHGRADILLNNGIPVSILANHDDNDQGIIFRKRLLSDASDDSAISENQTSDTLRNKDKKQLIAQTIVSSFLQRDEYETSLIPSVGISKNKVIVYLYDSKNDILLASSSLDLFLDDGKLKTGTVVFLWMTLNHQCFCSGVVDEMKAFRADFPKHVGDYIEKYRYEVKRPLPNCVPYEDESDSWAKIDPPFFGADLQPTTHRTEMCDYY